jgi:hypothetical protein
VPFPRIEKAHGRQLTPSKNRKHVVHKYSIDEPDTYLQPASPKANIPAKENSNQPAAKTKIKQTNGKEHKFNLCSI